jgi:hypothetical protein
MPVAPLAVALVAIAIDRVSGRGALAFVLMLAAWTGLFALALWRDPHAASDSALLLAKSTYADGHQYIPDLFIRRWSDGAPGLGARVLAWLAALAGIAAWGGRTARPAGPGRRPQGASPLATLGAVAGVMLIAGLLLERWPGTRTAAAFPEALRIAATEARDAPATTLAAPPVLFVSGAASVHEDEAILGPGAVDLLLRAAVPVASLRVTVGGPGGVLRAAGLPPIVLRPTGGLLDVPFVPYHEVRGRDGRRAVYSRASLLLDGEAVLRPGEGPLGNGTRTGRGSLNQDSE